MTTWEPTVWPVRPFAKPGTTWPRGNVVGPPLPQLWSKTLPLDQMTPVYCTVTAAPSATTAPAPFWSTSTLSVFGASVFGTVTVGVPSAASFTVGKPACGVCAAPLARVGTVFLTSITKTMLSVFPTPRLELPVAPNASAGGTTTATLEPTVEQEMPLRMPGITLWPEATVTTRPGLAFRLQRRDRQEAERRR